MGLINLYQTVKDENGADYIEEHGPFVCSRNDAWLGTGAYFWERDINLAHWWGTESYGKGGYVICQSSYEKYADDYFDLFGNTEHLAKLIDIKDDLKPRFGDKLALRKAIGVLKHYKRFPYKAVRIASDGDRNAKILIASTKKYKEYLQLSVRVQLCVLDQSFLKSDYTIVYPKEYVQCGWV